MEPFFSNCALQYGANTPRLAVTKAGVISHKTVLGKRYCSSVTLHAEPQLPSELKVSFMAVLLVRDSPRQGRLCVTQLAGLCLEKVSPFITEEVASFIIHDQKGF